MLKERYRCLSSETATNVTPLFKLAVNSCHIMYMYIVITIESRRNIRNGSHGNSGDFRKGKMYLYNNVFINNFLLELLIHRACRYGELDTLTDLLVIKEVDPCIVDEVTN